MLRTVKSLILIALLVAVPLRSFASGMMLFCGPAHHQGNEAAAAHEPAHHHGPAASHSPDAHHDHGHHDHTHTASLDDDAGAGADPGPGSSACSACGASCTAAIAPPACTPAPGITVSSAAITYLDRPFVGFVPEQADRPPLTLVR